MLELIIPQPGQEARCVKDLVFTILSHERPLSIIELSNKIKKGYNIGITYQAVRKAVDNLHKQDVLTKTGKKYSVNKAWVLRLKSFFDGLLTTYENQTPIRIFSAELAKEDYAVYTFNSLLDLDNFWGDIQMYWADHEKENKTFFSYTHYHWWLLINLGRETKIFEHFREKKVKSYTIFRNKSPLNLWAKRVYADLGVKNVIKEIDTDDSIVDINILGDTVIQVKYPKRIMDKVKLFFKKYRNVQEMSLREITQLAHEPCDIKFIMFKNPTIARDLRAAYVKHFK
ncbi:hypothetical protein KY362_07830 [Candidatus Woesearchaeota archaeon]|nr:hypothetical protein [Candidatus Woesearchaeota archaeon]